MSSNASAWAATSSPCEATSSDRPAVHSANGGADPIDVHPDRRPPYRRLHGDQAELRRGRGGLRLGAGTCWRRPVEVVRPAVVAALERAPATVLGHHGVSTMTADVDEAPDLVRRVAHDDERHAGHLERHAVARPAELSRVGGVVPAA